MKKCLAMILSFLMLVSCAGAESVPAAETVILLSDEDILVNGAPITENPDEKAYLAYQTETHPDVPEELKDVQNRVIVITDNGAYRISGSAHDAQIAVKAGAEDHVRLILDNMEISCRTAPGIIIHSGYDPRVPGEYGVIIHLADGSENKVCGAHTAKVLDTDVKFDGAIDSLISLGFEGGGKLTVDADKEGIEVKYGHMTINGGAFDVQSGDDPLNVSEDGVGVLTVNGGSLFSAVKPLAGGEGDGIDSNGFIIFNGGVVINLAHPASQDGGIDSDMGSSINGGVIVGAGNMYDPIEADSAQLFMMLEFTESTSDLVVVTDGENNPVFAYDFPHDYKYIAFSTPELEEGIYHVYLGGEIEGVCENGLYTEITAYTPGVQMTHGGVSVNQGRNGGAFGFGGMQPPEIPERMETPPKLPEDMERPEGMQTPPEMPEGGWPGWRGNRNHQRNDAPKGGFGGGFGGPRGMESSADTATGNFYLSRESTGFTNLTAIKE